MSNALSSLDLSSTGHFAGGVARLSIIGIRGPVSAEAGIIVSHANIDIA